MFNIRSSDPIEVNYQNGLLPQRNSRQLFYRHSSCRSNLALFRLSSENRRILNKTQDFAFKVMPLSDFSFAVDTQKNIVSWVKQLGWDFPTSSIKTVFTNHIFNTIYIWTDKLNRTVAYSINYVSPTLSHIAYVFYDPDLARTNLPIRLVLQVVIDSHNQKLHYCYLGRFDPQRGIGYYKRTMPGFEYFTDNNWHQLNIKS